MIQNEIIAELRLGFARVQRREVELNSTSVMKSYVGTMSNARRLDLFQVLINKFPRKVDFLEYASKILNVPYAGQLSLSLSSEG